MISVADAIARIAAAFVPLAAETVALDAALGRVLAEDVRARLNQPPVAVSAMDGYAVRAADVAQTPARLRLVGQAPAGGAYGGARLSAGEAVRIFTGASVPEGAEAIVIQENVATLDAETIEVRVPAPRGSFIRPAGLDFRQGDIGLKAGRRLRARDIGLAAAMNVPWLSVRRAPRIALLATGDEIVMPGEALGPHQIISSNGPALAAAVRALGGEPINLGIAPDRPEALERLLAAAAGADLLLTTGGVSVGDRDLVRPALDALGFREAFWRIAMRPGKPVLFGHLPALPVIGLPGNPVSVLVGVRVLVEPAIAAMLALDASERPRPRPARLASALPANDARQDYLRAALIPAEPGDLPRAMPLPVQDSAMLAGLAGADGLIVRPPHAAAAAAGDLVEIIAFDTGLIGL